MKLTLHTNHPLEIAVDVTAASAFAAAVAFAGSSVGGLSVPLVGLASFAATILILHNVAPAEAPYVLPPFAEPEAVGESEELLLTDDMKAGAAGRGRDELILDDVLAQLGPESRVVRLFEPRQIPTAGELKASIDRHFGPSRAVVGPPDASQALSDALVQLRRSLH